MNLSETSCLIHVTRIQKFLFSFTNYWGLGKHMCMRVNAVNSCNPEGSRRASDKIGLAEQRDTPSLYVGETSRSLKERAGEHWADAGGWKEESHMVEHQMLAHREEDNPDFRFKVVKKCGSSLDRQVREAV